MGRLLVRIVPGMVMIAAAATVTVAALRLLARLQEERVWQEAWDAYRKTDTAG
jgi:hypothetical protein